MLLAEEQKHRSKIDYRTVEILKERMDTLSWSEIGKTLFRLSQTEFLLDQLTEACRQKNLLKIGAIIITQIENDITDDARDQATDEINGEL